MELIIAKAVEDLIALLGADGADIADEIFAGMQKEESPEALGGAEDAGGNSLLSDRAGFRIRPGEVGSASWDTLLDFAEAKVRAIEKKAIDEAEKRRSGSYRLDGDYETLLLTRGRRAMKDDEAMAMDIEEKAEEEVQALKSAMSTLQAGILARAELVQEEDAAKKEDDPKLDDAVQESLRTHGINVQRYWNGAVSNIYLLHLFENFSR